MTIQFPIKTLALALGLAVTSGPALAAPASPSAVAPAPIAVSVAPVALHDRWEDRWDDRWDDDWRRRGYGRGDGYYEPYRRGDYYEGRRWRDDRRWRGDRVRYYDGPIWRGRDGRFRCRRDNGTTGLLIGGAAGAVIGSEIAGRRGDRTAGAILGGVAGALIGRSIDRNDNYRCR